MQIETERLILREFVTSVTEAMVAIHSDPRYRTYYPPHDDYRLEAEEFVERFIGFQLAQPRIKFQMAVTLRSTGELIGSCGAHAREADIGYGLSPDHWGRGYATEAAARMLCFAFLELDVDRVTARTLAENEASVRVLKKLGMEFAELRANKEFFGGRSWDEVVFAITRAEWAASPAAQ
jgi:[ribosomal protein S5]-alanine N-acetyltransferase